MLADSTHNTGGKGHCKNVGGQDVEAQTGVSVGWMRAAQDREGCKAAEKHCFHRFLVFSCCASEASSCSDSILVSGLINWDDEQHAMNELRRKVHCRCPFNTGVIFWSPNARSLNITWRKPDGVTGSEQLKMGKMRSNATGAWTESLSGGPLSDRCPGGGRWALLLLLYSVHQMCGTLQHPKRRRP